MILFLTLALASAEETTDEIKRDMKALEIYLQDKKDHKEECPKISWKQPELSIYKKELKSQLPKECKDKK